MENKNRKEDMKIRNGSKRAVHVHERGNGGTRNGNGGRRRIMEVEVFEWSRLGRR